MHLPEAPAWVGAAASLIRRLPRGRYRATNLIGRRRTGPFWARLPADLGALAFRCDLRDRIMREVCFTGRYEPQETALVVRLLKPGMTFVDVGANWGYFTLAAAHLVGPRGRVVAVEADPAACDALRTNVAHNGLGHVAVLERAASDRRGRLVLQQYESEASASGNYGLASTTTVAESGRRFDVEACELDEELDELGIENVALLKMDIEGAEGRALSGLRRRLAAHRIARILLEVHPDHLRDQGTSAEQVIAELGAHGYRPWLIDHSADATRRAVGCHADVATTLEPLADASRLPPWPHVLWVLDDGQSVAGGER